MTDLEIIEQHLKIDTDTKILRDGKKKRNKNRFYYFRNQFYVVELTRNKWMVCSDDNNTRRLLRLYTWYDHSKGYAGTHIGNTFKRWHQLYMEYDRPTVADHINNRRYDNRAENLRLVQQKENMRNRKKQKNNTSGKQGVTRKVRGGCVSWIVQIRGPEGNPISKCYSVNKLGEELAKKQAIEKRVELERLYGYIGD